MCVSVEPIWNLSAWQLLNGSLRDVRALGPAQEVWDSVVPGFVARRQKGAIVAYVLMYRTREGRRRRYTIGRHGAPWTPDTARDEAIKLLGKIKGGADPARDKREARQAMTVTELCDAYLGDADAGRLLTRRGNAKKLSTLTIDRGRIERHIKPLLGRTVVAAVERRDVERFMHAVAEGKTAGRMKTRPRGLARVRGGKGTATRAVGLLGGIFTYAISQGLRSDNPVRGVVRFADGRRERRLSDDEYRLLGAALRQGEAKGTWPAAVAAGHFLALTGWRSGEALGLRWTEVDLARRTATLADSKTGRSVRPLSRAACDVLRTLRNFVPGELVFPATRGDGRMSGFPGFWQRMARLGELPADVTPHVLRHSFASLAGDLGYSESTIAALVGHKGHSVTSRYVHAADAVLLAAADKVADRTAELMGNNKRQGEVVEFRIG
jgi:integrase